MEDCEGYIHSVETAGTVDGPGMRFVVFVTGCPLRCLYCHNPDTRELRDGKRVMASELVDEIARYKDFILRQGGVTVSGGEPLFQQRFVTSILQGCKAMGLHTAVDTSGYLGALVKQSLLDVTDLFLLDIKAFDEELHQRLTGKKLAPVLDFARHLAAHNKPMWVRCVIVPDLTDNMEDLTRMADFLAALGSVEKVEILPFHKMGEPKWQALGLNYELSAVQPPEKEQIRAICELFRGRGFEVV
ncbi:MAG: pyruvate formate-lyase-activating protein [Alphaproteobacteria bacterium]|nr:pyruvate formate-lyase-activating protein [Alphaproteobacteria bacterium]